MSFGGQAGAFDSANWLSLAPSHRTKERNGRNQKEPDEEADYNRLGAPVGQRMGELEKLNWSKELLGHKLACVIG